MRGAYLLTDAGREHPLFAGKPLAFEAPTVHRDEIASLPAGAAMLAVNDFGVQAAAFSVGRGTFWGVQYHPEYDYVDIAAAAERYGETLVERRHVPRRPGARRIRRRASRPAGESRRCAAALEARAWARPCSNEALRLLEIRNWLHDQALPRA